MPNGKRIVPYFKDSNKLAIQDGYAAVISLYLYFSNDPECLIKLTEILNLARQRI